MSLSKQQNDVSLDQPPHFLKVNADCWERIFDLLSLRDILAMSETCQRMRQMSGYYFREYFPDIQCKWIANRGIFIGYPSSILKTDFCQFITKLMVYDYLEHFLIAEQYCSLKTLVLCSIELTDTQIDFIKNVLSNVENLDLKRCTIYGDIYEKFLKYCPKLKCLRLHEILFEPEDTSNQFFQQTYTSLQYIDFSTFQIFSITNNELKNFFEQNKDLKHFGISNHFLWTNRELFIESNAHLDSFCIRTEVSDEMAELPAVEFVNLLKVLYERGFFKSLHFKMIETDENIDYQELLNEMATLDAFEVLVTNEFDDLSRLVNLKELWMLEYHHATNMETLAINASKIERIYLQKATTDHIRLFFQHSKKLKSVKVYEMIGGDLLKGGVLNLYALNLERETLRAVRRVSVCVQENIYLATKKRRKNQNLGLVEIARWNSDEWSFFDQTYSF